jgi:CsoR family transcriptional regulator, copper-sensing transcriptional repressor
MSEHHQDREPIVKRLKRIEGQIKGLVRMLEEDRYCIQTAKAALTKAETELLRAHARDCMDAALQRGSIEEKREKIVELVELFERVR